MVARYGWTWRTSATEPLSGSITLVGLMGLVGFVGLLLVGSTG